jgi:hypothetical protein
MSTQQEIRLLKNREIDFAKWDDCIQNAPNGNLYAKSWYLDVVSPEWGALIWDDYRFVMPLPVIKKMAIRMIIQPLHCQQLGIFPAPVLEIQQQFAEKLKKSFRIINYQLNAGMLIHAFPSFENIKRTNYILPLHLSYEETVSGFSRHTIRNLTAAENAQVKVVKGLLPSDFFKSKKEAETRKVSEKSYRILHQLIAQTLMKGNGVIYAAYSQTNNLCAAAYVLFDQNKAYYLNAFSTEEGRENRAMYAIVNELIKEFSRSATIIDFEGSVIEGVARFYKGFGAIGEDYYFIRSNSLPIVGKKLLNKK